MLEEETNMAPQAKHNETPNETKWDNPSNTDVDAESDQEKHGKKRDKSRLTKIDKQDEKEGDDSTMETTKYPHAQMSSPKRVKKIKVDGDPIRARERTRSQSRQRTPNQF